MRRAADLVEEQAGQPQAAVKLGVAFGHRSRGARQRRRVHHQHHRRAQPLGQLRGGASFGGAVAAIKQPHDALHHRHVGAGDRSVERAQHLLPAEHPGVKVDGGAARGGHVVHGVEKVWDQRSAGAGGQERRTWAQQVAGLRARREVARTQGQAWWRSRHQWQSSPLLLSKLAAYSSGSQLLHPAAQPRPLPPLRRPCRQALPGPVLNACTVRPLSLQAGAATAAGRRA